MSVDTDLVLQDSRHVRVFSPKDDNLGSIEFNHVTCVRGRVGRCGYMPRGGG